MNRMFSELEEDRIYDVILYDIKASLVNPDFKMYKNKFLLTKSNKKKKILMFPLITTIKKAHIPKLRKIEKEAFFNFRIESINIPTTCVDGLLCDLDKIEIDPKNPNYKQKIQN